MQIHGRHEDIPSEDLRHLIASAFEGRDDLGEVSARILGGGYSGALVALCATDLLDPVVLKAGPTESITAEHRHRSDYAGDDAWLAEHGLGRVNGPIEIEVDGRLTEWATMFYRYVGGRHFEELADFKDFGGFIRSYLWSENRDGAPSDRTVEACLREATTRLGGTHGADPPKARPLSDFIPEVQWHTGVGAVLSAAREFCPDLAELEDFRTWWESRIAEVEIAPFADRRRLHGDARFANIVVDDVHAQVQLIDYGNGRRGHVFEDFARFEVDLLFEAVPRLGDTGRTDTARLHDTVTYLLRNDLNLGDEPPKDRSQKVLWQWRRAMVRVLPEITRPGPLTMYRWFLLRECLRRTRWVNVDVAALIYTICALRRRLSADGPLGSSWISTAPQSLAATLHCRAVYVAERGAERAVNRVRNEAKRRALATAKQNTSMVRLMAETGHSFLAARSTFSDQVRELLEEGGSFQAVIYNPHLPEYLGLSRSYDGDEGAYRVSERLKVKTEESIEGFRMLKDDFGARVELRFGRFAFGATVLITPSASFYEPYFKTSRRERERHLFDSFELEFDGAGTHSAALLGQTFDFAWRHADDIESLEAHRDRFAAATEMFTDLPGHGHD